VAIAVSVLPRSASTICSPAFHSPPPGFPYAAAEAGNARIGPPAAPRPFTSLLSPFASDAESGKPFVASSAAGMTTSFHASLPKRLCASAMPRTVPGTPGAR
jgi:hypothetical protein